MKNIYKLWKMIKKIVKSFWITFIDPNLQNSKHDLRKDI